jgi:peroxiredoxin
MKKLLMGVLLLVSFMSFGDHLEDVVREAGLIPLKDGTKIVDFELQNLEGNAVALSDFSGKVVFLNFWATWCGPCRIEMPSMQKLYEQLSERGLEIVAVDVLEQKDDVALFVEEFGLTFSVLLDTSGRVSTMYGANNIPISYIIDREGNGLAGTIGAREWDAQEVVGFFEVLLDIEASSS